MVVDRISQAYDDTLSDFEMAKDKGPIALYIRYREEVRTWIPRSNAPDTPEYTHGFGAFRQMGKGSYWLSTQFSKVPDFLRSPFGGSQKDFNSWRLYEGI